MADAFAMSNVPSQEEANSKRDKIVARGIAGYCSGESGDKSVITCFAAVTLLEVLFSPLLSYRRKN